MYPDTEMFGYLGSGQPVYDRYNSHNHVAIRSILLEALSWIRLNGEQFAVEEVEFGRVVGETTCVRTSESDAIVFAQRPRRFGLTRFVLGRKPEPSSKMVVILKKAEDGDYYVLISAFVGARAEPEPWDRNATEKSVEFWSTHALVWGSEPVAPGTETRVCPW
ncbi:MAG: hypothetical protein ABIG91_03565 [Patescibacteria group bacterium]